jgi:hypothetical protein
MPARSRRPEILAVYERILTRWRAEGGDPSVTALELVAAAEHRGINFDRPVLIEDHAAGDWRPGQRPAGDVADTPDLTELRARLAENRQKGDQP